MVEFDAALAQSDLVITGEGRLDRQTAQGKVLSGVLGHAHRMRKPVVAVVGSCEGPPESFIGPEKLEDLQQLVSASTHLDQAIANASSLIRDRTIALLRRLVAWS